MKQGMTLEDILSEYDKGEEPEGDRGIPASAPTHVPKSTTSRRRSKVRTCLRLAMVVCVIVEVGILLYGLAMAIVIEPILIFVDLTNQTLIDNTIVESMRDSTFDERLVNNEWKFDAPENFRVGSVYPFAFAELYNFSVGIEFNQDGTGMVKTALFSPSFNWITDKNKKVLTLIWKMRGTGYLYQFAYSINDDNTITHLKSIFQTKKERAYTLRKV